MAKKSRNSTKHEIIRTATRLFLEKGYSATTPKLICDELEISTGNLTYYFPTKEHLLAVLVELLCRFQAESLSGMVNKGGNTSIFAVCLELATMAAMCEQSEIAKDLFLAAYSNPMPLEIIRKSDAQRAKIVYHEYCTNWTELQFAEAETLVSGVEYATLMTTGDSAPLENRITSAINNVMTIFSVPEDVRNREIRRVLSLDYQALGLRVMENFKQFVIDIEEETLEVLLNGSG